MLFSAACEPSGGLPAAIPSPPAPVVVDRTMVAVPAGSFAMGSNDGDDDERPVHRVELAAFAIDRTEVTVRAYRACMQHDACSAPGRDPYCNIARIGSDEQPINCVEWEQARVFCAWQHKRLPSEAEWEYAARGADGRKYPWGDAKPSTQVCWDGKGSDMGAGRRRGTCAVGAHPGGQSAFGLEDMEGNVWEWIADPYSPAYDQPPTDLRILRGGTWFGYDREDLRSTLRMRMDAHAHDYGIGFRCAKSI
jgi:formylglycine-generating enzyme required for sulfatase activity